MPDSRFYRILSREESGILLSLREFLAKKAYLEFSIFKKSGGRNGDLGHQLMEYELYLSGEANGMIRGCIALYAVTDDGANGYARMISVIVSLPEDEKATSEIATYLTSLDFVGRYSSFRERPYGTKSMRSYLDEIPGFPLVFDAFKYEREDPAGPSKLHMETHAGILPA